MLENVKRAHFVGIGGTGMLPLAQVLLEAGIGVQGSDLRSSSALDRLESMGATVFIGHRAEQVDGSDLVIISSAIVEENPEVARARELGLPIAKRAQVWGELMTRQQTIAVAGTHGKTTTTAMISTVLIDAGLDPTILVGSEVLGLSTAARLGHGDYLVAEADEYDGSFLKFAPWAAVITNIEGDHLDYYGSVEAIVVAFQRFISLLPAGGLAVLCWDDTRVRSIMPPDGVIVISYGFAAEAEFRAENVRRNAIGGNDFTLVFRGAVIGDFSLRLPGRHNVANATAALAISSSLRVPWDEARRALRGFRGTRRRLEFRGSVMGALLYDDYAHHPTEVRATLSALREQHTGRLVVLFQPHTYHRTKQLLPEFADAFNLADRVLVADIYTPTGREVETFGVTALDLVDVMRHSGATYVGTLDMAIRQLEYELAPGDCLITMGAGDVTTVADTLLLGKAEGGH